MSEILEAIDVEVPVRTAYDQWTQFEEFPRFMEGVKSVRQLDDTHLEWDAEIAGVDKQWQAEITEQTPDQRIAWQATDGARNAGVVTFHRLDDGRSRVTLQLDVEPEGPVESAGDALGFVQRRAKGDLERFKSFIEDRRSRASPCTRLQGEVRDGPGDRHARVATLESVAPVPLGVREPRSCMGRRWASTVDRRS
jgi:uncharacterized membrane protein